MSHMGALIFHLLKTYLCLPPTSNQSQCLLLMKRFHFHNTNSTFCAASQLVFWYFLLKTAAEFYGKIDLLPNGKH